MTNIPSVLKKTALVSALMLATGSQAAIINVDGVTCNLNDAMTAANTDAVVGGCSTGAGTDVLELTTGTFNLTASTVDVTTAIRVNGNDSTIQPDPGGAGFRLFTVQAGGDLTINDATLANGVSSVADRNFGGAARSYDGILNINGSTLTGNLGGAVVFTRSTGSLVDSVVDGNDSYGAAAAYYGGGVSIATSTVTIANSTISNNNTMSGTAGGGGIYITNYGGSDVTISNTTISGNTSVNAGGGIGHLAYGAGGTTMSLTNVTVVNNTSTANGGGFSNDIAVVTVSQSLISGNTAVAGAEINSTGGSITVDDYNLFGLNSVSGVVGVTIGATDIVPTEAALTDIVDVNLVDNGGPTPTHLPVAGGPAVDVIPGASCALGTDQIGNSRPIGSGCDVGAVELAGGPMTFMVGGSLDGLLSGNSVTLQNNAGDDLVLTADDVFVFSMTLNDTDVFDVTVLTQPTSPNQTCTVVNGSGTIAAADVVNVEVSCDSLDLIFKNGFEAPLVD